MKNKIFNSEKLEVKNTIKVEGFNGVVVVKDNTSLKPFSLSSNTNDSTTQDINEPSEIGEALKELNNDTIEGDTSMSGIDMRSNLHPLEISGILALDSMVAFKFLPVCCLGFTRQKKRIAVSLRGKGREDIVNIVGGHQEHLERKSGLNLGEKVSGWFGNGTK